MAALSDQKTYGLYGLFRMAAYNSGWLDPERRRSCRRGRGSSSSGGCGRLPRQVQEQIVRSIAKDTTIDLDKSPIVDALADLLRPQLSSHESQFYGSHLVRGEHLREALTANPTVGMHRGRQLAVPGVRWGDEFGMAELLACIDEARTRGHGELAGRLDRIRRAEELLGAAAKLYDFLLTQDKQTMDTVAKRNGPVLGEV